MPRRGKGKIDYGKYLEATNNPNWKNKNSPDGKNQLTGLQAEFAYERKFAIISPTIRKKSPEILKGLKSLFDRMWHNEYKNRRYF